MAIRFYLGKPGGGKSFRALKEIVDELAHGQRVIVTNLSVKLPELNAYLQERFPEKSIDLHERVRVLTEDEAREFYLHRAHGVDFRAPADEDVKRNGARVDYGDLHRLVPVMYVIDEVHTFFDSRNWMSSGPHVTHYNSQHRKFGDEVFFVTQFLELVDKRLRGFSQDFTVVRNHRLERMFLFRGVPYHSAATYLSPPAGMASVATHVERFTLDLRLAQCYDTTAGVGISGRGKPQERKIKGLNPLWAIPAVVGVIAAIFYAPDFLTRAVTGGIGRMGGVAAAGVDRLAGVPGGGGAVSSDAVSTAAAEVDQPLASVVWPTGYLRRGRRVIVVMSDGTTRTDRDTELEAVERNSITLSGRKLFLRSRWPLGSGDGASPVRAEPVALASLPPSSTAIPGKGSGEGSVSGGWVMGADGMERLRQPAVVLGLGGQPGRPGERR